MRKQPKQERSQQVVDSILNAAEELLPSVIEADNVTTQKIALRAGVSIGSLYQYFPNRESILIKLIEKDLESTERLFKEHLEKIRNESIDFMIESIIDRGFEIFMRNRRFKRVLFPQAIRLKRVREIIETRNVLARCLADFLEPIAQQYRITNTQRTAYVLSHALQGLLQTVLMSSKPPYADPELKLEMVRMIRGYLGIL